MIVTCRTMHGLHESPMQSSRGSFDLLPIMQRVAGFAKRELVLRLFPSQAFHFRKSTTRRWSAHVKQ